MSQFIKNAEKTAWQVIADPAEPEAAWVPACHAVAKTQVSRSVNLTTRMTGVWALVALATAVLATRGARIWVECGFDWGYYLVDSISKQPSSEQGFVAAMVNGVFVPPVIFSIFAGQIRGVFQKCQWISLSPVIATLGYFGWIISLSDGPDGRDPSTLIQMFTFCIIAMILSQTCYLVSAGLTRWLNSISRTKAVLWLPMSLFALTPLVEMAVQSKVNYLGEKWLPEFSLYVAFIAATSFFGAFGCKSRKTLTSSVFAFSAALPVLGIMMLNIAGTIASLCLDTVGWGAALGWRACLSACLIAAATGLSVAGSGFAAAKLQQLRLQPGANVSP